MNILSSLNPLSWGLPSLWEHQPDCKQPDFNQFVVQGHNLFKTHQRLIVEGGQLRNVSLQTGPEAEKQNQTTWSLFKKAVENQFSRSRIERVCKDRGIAWQDVANKEVNFDPFYIEYFGAGAAVVKDYELEELADCGLSSLTCDQLRSVYERATGCAYLGEQKDPKDLHGAPYAFHEHVTHNRLLESQRLGTLFKGVENLVSKDPNLPRLSLYYSRLAMAIACLFTATEDDVGKVIPAPGCNDGELDFYKVHSVVSKGGLTAYFLVPIAKDSHLSPTVIFRCTNQAFTQMNAMHSVKNCLIHNIGEWGWNECKKEIATIMKDPSFTQGRKLKTLAYSLGGSHQGYFVREYLEHIDEVYAFNAVGNEAQVALDIADKVNHAPADYKPPAFWHIRNIHDEKLGDCVNYAGEMRVGCKLKHPNAQVTLIERILDDRPPPDPEDPTQAISFEHYHADRLERRCHYNIYRGASAYRKLNPKKHMPEMEQKRKEHGQFYLEVFWPIYELIEFIFALYDIRLFKRVNTNNQGSA